jgi:hypothetical protein
MGSLPTVLRKWLPVLVIASIAMYFASSWYLESDESLARVRAFVAVDPEIAKIAGKVEKITTIKRVAVDAASDQKVHRLYTLDIRGSQSKVVAVVRVTGDAGNEEIVLQSVAR